MILRRNVAPKKLEDALVTLLLFIMIPVIYYFELFVVLPRYYALWSRGYCFHFITGSFIMFNICSNFVAIIICDTSIKGRILPTSFIPNSNFCSVCECIAPPRAWHCTTCNVCILKRDHHCIFTSCCIGHGNHRYFLMFVLYLFAATLYATYHNVFFVYEFTEISSWESIVRLVFPLAMLFVKYSLNQMYTFLALVIVIGCIFTGVLFFFHVDLILRGVVTPERKNLSSIYDLGRKANVKYALGDRWYLIWLSPFVESELLNDGVNWDVKQSAKAK